MKSIQKVLTSLLISVVASGFFYLAGIFGLFETLEYVFYETRIQERVSNDLARTENLLQQYEEDIFLRAEELLQQPSFQQAFLINQTSTLIQQRRQLIQDSFSLTPGLTSLRIFEPDFSRLYYSTRITDILESTAQRIVYRPVVDINDLEFIQSLVPESLEYEEIYVLDPSNNLFYLIRPVYDDVNLLRGHGVFVGTFRPFENRLIQNGLLPVDRSSFFLNDNIFLVNIDDSIRSALATVDINQLQTTEGLFGRIDIDTNRFVFLSYAGQSYSFATLIPEQELLLSDPLQWFLVILIFSSVFLFVFLLLNLRHDSIVVITDRIKRFQISLVQEYLENKENLDLHKWKTELRLRKDDVYNQILKGIPKRKRNDKALEQLLDASWEEILEVLGSKKMLTSGTSQLDIDRIEQAMQRVVSSLQNVELQGHGNLKVSTSNRSKGKKGLPQVTKEAIDKTKPLDVEVISQGKDAELSGDLEELDELDELDEVSEAEELEEVDDLEEFDDLEEVEELNEIDEVDQLDSDVEPEEIDELVEVGELEEVDELEEVEELDEVQQLDSDVEPEEIDELEEVEQLEELDELKEIDETDETDEIINREELDEQDEVSELEELDETEETVDIAKDSKITKEEQLINALDEDKLDSIEMSQETKKIQPVQSNVDLTADETDIDELEELSELEELEELDEEAEELALELGSTSGSGRQVNTLSEVISASEIEDTDDAEEALELESGHYTDSLVHMASYLQSPLWSRTMDHEDVEELEALENLDEQEELETSDPVFLLASFEGLISDDEKVFITKDDGIIQISDSVFQAQDQKTISVKTSEAQTFSSKDDELELINKQENDDFFGIPDIDFELPESKGNEDATEFSPGPRYYRKKEYGEIKFTQKGFDFDSFASTFRKDGPGRVKSLVTLSRLLNSRFAAIFTENERGIFYKSGVGYSAEVAPMSPEDPLFQYYLKRDSITLLNHATNYNYLMPQHEKTMGTLNQLVFVPCVYEGESGFVILGPSDNLSKPEEFLTYFKQLLVQPIESI